MLYTGITAYIVLNIIEFGAFRMVKQLIFRNIDRTYPYTERKKVDDDVSAEKERINGMTGQELKTETMVMRNASKFYGNLCAVNKFSVSIEK